MIDEISTLPGRVRFRSSEFYGNKLLARYVNTYMEGLYGVNYSSINHNTGSILIIYDVEKTNRELLADDIQAAIISTDNIKKEKMQQNGIYYKCIEKREISINVPTDSDILLSLTAISFTILRESSKGVFVLILKNFSDYIKYSSEVECLRTLNSGMGKTSGMAWLISCDNKEILVPIDNLSIGDMIYIHKGEISPVHGKIVSGTAVINSLYNTGQPIVTNVGSGNMIQDGATIISGELKVKVESIQNLREKQDLPLTNLSIHKEVGAYQKIITKIAIGAASINYILTGNILNALAVLLALTPSATGTALSDGMKNYVAVLKSHNIYLRNPNTFEKIVNTDSVMFDKTGTLTYGKMRIVNIESFNKDYSNHELLRICAACEVDNYHPISITLHDYIGDNYDVSKVKSSVLIPSQGIEAVYDNHKLLIGNIKLFNKKNIDITNGISKYEKIERMFDYPIFIAIDNELVGIISMKDEIRNNANLLIDKLKYRGINNVSLLTGDIYEKTKKIAKMLGIEKVYAQCSNEDKLSVITEENKAHTVMMVGDGINDINAMKAAGVSISFANSACDNIKLNSDCIIFEENIDRLADLIYMSQRSNKLIRQSITFSQLSNITFGTLAFFQYFDAFTAKSLNTINSLIVLLLNERIRWVVPDKMFEYELNRKLTRNL